MRVLIRKLLDRSGLRVHRGSALPWGHEILADVNRFSRLLDHPIRTVFDVGANVGLTSREMLDRFRYARLHAFEPHPGAFAALQRNVSSERFNAHNFALGDEPGETVLYDYGEESTIHSLVPNSPYVVARNLQHLAKATIAKVETIDSFCRQHRIDTIDLLKIDTEGLDLSVLRGAQEMLRQGAIKFISSEYHTIRPAEGRHGGSLLELDDLLAAHGYKFTVSYTDNVLTTGEILPISNALYVHQH